jgi:hypothetical protein
LEKLSKLTSFSKISNLIRCIFSPDEKLIITGTSVATKEQESGLLVFIDRKLLRRVKQIGVAPGQSVVSMVWHKKINQMLVGTSSGKVNLIFESNH